MTRRAILEYAEAIRPRYLLAGKREKEVILDEFCQNTRYHRKSAIRLLHHPPEAGARRRGRERQYGTEVAQVLKVVWEASDHLCSKRLVPFLPDLLDALERHGEIEVTAEVKGQLLSLSPATMDRLLKPLRPQGLRRPHTQSQSTAVLKAQIPVRTFGDWQGVQPGSFQGDLVSHCGENTIGFYLASLMLVDVAVGWIELEAIWGKGQQRVRAGVHQARRRLPLPLREWHTDNGGEFINQVLYPYCRKEGIQVTRGRPYKKNDQAYVEQKNWSVVRRVVGYDRYTSKAALAALQEVYEPLRLYMNFFQPLRKLIGKERVGAKVRKRYDRAQTAYQRLSAAGVLEPSQAERLHRQYLSLNPVRLRSDIDAALRNLWRLADRGLAKEEAKRVACG